MAAEKKPYALIAEADPERAARYLPLVLELGLEPNHARDGESAKTTLRTRGAPALLVTELSLPRTDGFQLLADLRLRFTAEQTPAIVVSGFLELRSRAWELRDELGIAEVLSTGAAEDTLKKALRRALSAARSAAQRPAGPAELPTIDAARLSRLRAPGLGDPEAPAIVFDELADELAQCFRAPLALVHVYGRGWFRAHAGPIDSPLRELAAREWESLERLFSPEPAGSALGGDREPLLVPDLAIEPRRMLNPLVKRGLVRSLLSVPLSDGAGRPLARLALVHPRRGSYLPEHLDALTALGRRLVGEVEARSLSERHERSSLEALLDELDAGIVLFDEERRAVFANRALSELLGWPIDAIVGASFDELNERNVALFDDPSEYRRKLHVLPSGPFVLREQLTLDRPKKRVVRWVMKPVPLATGLGQLSLLTDITAEVELEAQRARLARTDGLTGLPNRVAAEEALVRELQRARREELPLAVALVGVDRLAQLNEARGRSAGDAALQAIAREVASALRGGDLVARWGGDELLLVLPGVGRDGARAVGARVCQRVRALALTLSVGTADVLAHEPPDTSLRRAAAALAAVRARDGDGVE